MSGTIELRLDARGPFAGPDLLRFLAGRAIPGVEEVSGGHYRRLVRLGDVSGGLEVGLDPERPGVVARLDRSLEARQADVVARVRALFDLDATPELVDEHLGRDPALARHVAEAPGLRVPGAFDGWELAVRAVLGQQVSVRAATTISGRLVQRFGERVVGSTRTADSSGAAGSGATAGPRAAERVAADVEEPRQVWLFPAAATLADAPVDEVGTIGLPRSRAATIVALARAVAGGAVDLSPGADVQAAVAALQGVKGIGPWTAHYIAMRLFRDPDIFLASDLAARKALGVASPKEAEQASVRWRPFRAYALMHLWRSLA